MTAAPPEPVPAPADEAAPAPESEPASPTVDAHVNLASDLAVPARFIDEQARNVHARLTGSGAPAAYETIRGRVAGLYQDHDADRLVAEMDGAGVDRTMLVIPDFSHVAECALDRPALAALHDKVRRRHPGRFGVYWGVDPRAGEEGPALLEHCVDAYGFEGVKLYPLAGYSPSDRRLYPYYEICAARGLPVLTHTGPAYQSLDYSYGSPLLVDHAARDFPGVNFVLGHGGVRNVEEAAYLCRHRPNVYLDIAGYAGALDPQGSSHHLASLFRRGVNHKILFGTDWSAHRLTHTLGGLISAFRDSAGVLAGVKPAHRRLIMGGTALALTGGSR